MTTIGNSNTSAVAPWTKQAITNLAPGYQALSLSVEATDIVTPDVAHRALRHACQLSTAENPTWAAAHLLFSQSIAQTCAA